MSFDSFPHIHEVLDEGKIVAGIFGRLKDGESIDSIELPATAADAQEYIRKLEIIKKGTIMPFPVEQTEMVHRQVDAYIEKLKEVRNEDQAAYEHKIAA